MSDQVSTTFRHMSDQFSTTFRRMSDQFSTSFRRMSDQFSTSFRCMNCFRHHFDNLELHFDELMDYISTLMIGYDRTMFLSKRFKRGLCDAIPLPRTTPDKHENYHQCVPSSGCYVIPAGWTFREGPNL